MTLQRLVVTCADRPGIVSGVAGFLARAGANIVASDQYSTDAEGGRFHLRMELHHPGDRAELRRGFAATVAEPLGLRWRLVDAARHKRTFLLASRYDHCLLDLLWRWRRGELNAEVIGVISNHRDVGADVAQFEVPFHHVPVEPGRKHLAEAEMLDLVRGEADLVVLARYMQILTGDFLERVGAPVINIHHSFLPAFAGAGPYERAKERGVKLIGATAHYVTEELDAGPIIEQDVVRVTHRETVAELVRRGADVERSVLARAVAWHCDDRVIVDGDTTVVF